MLTEFFRNLWITMFGTTEWLGLNIGFWVSMLGVILLVVIMIVVFWAVKPKKDIEDGSPKTFKQKHSDTTEQ